MITHSFDLDMIPNQQRARVWLNQYDDDFVLRIHLYASRGAFVIESGTTVEIRGTKPDGNGFSADATLTIEDGEPYVTVTGNNQITAAAGNALFELTLYKSGKELNTANFVIWIEHAALDRDTIPSDSELKEFVDVYDRADEIIAAGAQYEAAEIALRETAAEAAASAQTASEAATSASSTYSEYQQRYAQDYAALTEYTEDALDEIEAKRAAIQSIATNADTTSQQALQTANDAEDESTQCAADIQALIGELNSTNATVATKFDGTYIENGYLYLTSGGETVAGPFEWYGTQTEYDALTQKLPNVTYYIVEDT